MNRFPDPAKLFVHPIITSIECCKPGDPAGELEVGAAEMKNPRKVWRIFAENSSCFRGTPTRMWLDHAFRNFLDLPNGCAQECDVYSTPFPTSCGDQSSLPRALYDQFKIDVLATAIPRWIRWRTMRHSRIRLEARILPTFRPVRWWTGILLDLRTMLPSSAN